MAQLQAAHLEPLQDHEVAEVCAGLDALSQGGHSGWMVPQVCLLKTAS